MSDSNLSEIINKCLDNQVKSVIFLSNPENISTNYLNIVKFLNIDKQFLGTVINFKNPSTKEKELFNNQGMDVNKVSFIDSVTVAADHFSKDEKIFFLLNPNDLDGVQIGMDSILKKNPDIKYVLIDLLDILLYYNSIDKIENLLNYLKSILLEKEISFFVLASKENKMLIDKVVSIFDQKIDL